MTHDLPSTLNFPGIDAESGLPVEPPTSARQFAQRILRSRAGRTSDVESETEADLRAEWLERKQMGPDRRPAAGVDPLRPASSGWGVIFPQQPKRFSVAELEEQLAPLIALRRRQVGPPAKDGEPSFFRKLAYGPGSLKNNFLNAGNLPSGPADPKVLPYYLLLVGDLEEIPLRFQYLLDVQYAVGRLAFDDLEDYGRYARAVAAVEAGERRAVRPEAAFFSVRHAGDRATRLSDTQLVGALLEILQLDRPEWPVQAHRPGLKTQLETLLCGGEPPALFFSASHGVSYRGDDPQQPLHQGDILCGEWTLGTSVGPDHRFGSDDLGDADLHGMVAFLFGCFSAGTPDGDNFPPRALRNPQPIAPRPFVSKLAQGLLARGALAVMGHVDRAWSCTFGADDDHGARHVESMVKYLLDGYTVGHAMDWMNERNAELAAQLTDALDERREASAHRLANALWLTNTWRAHADARNFVVLGDPAVSLPVGPRRALRQTAGNTAKMSVAGRSTGELRQILGRMIDHPAVSTTESPAEVLRRLAGGRPT